MLTMFNFHVSPVSGNKKTGPIPVTTTGKNSCPDSCPLKENGCYAAYGPTNLHWNKVTSGERGISESEFLNRVKKFPGGQVWRHNQAGDLPHVDGEIDSRFMTKLAKANKGKNGFTYTHHLPDVGNNAETIRESNRNGFAVNVSCNDIESAVETFDKLGLPVVTLLPLEAPNTQLVGGTKVIACPAEKSDKVTCSTCKLCADTERDYIIGFRAHGTAKKKANLIATGG